MRALIALALGGCLSSAGRAIPETSPRFAELAPRRIAVVVVGEEPRDAQARIDRFGLTYPAPIRPDTTLPHESDASRGVSAMLSEGLMGLLRERGYEVTALSGAGARVGDLLRPEVCDAVLVVQYRAATRWPISEYQGGATRGTFEYDITKDGLPPGERRSERYGFMIERGLLFLPTAYLLDTRTSARLWSRSNLGLDNDRVEMASPLRKMGVVVEVEHEPPPLDELIPKAIAAVVPFYFGSIPAAPSRARPSAARQADLREEAAVDRFREWDRWVIDAGGGFARRTFRAAAGPVELDGADAFTGTWEVEAGVRRLGRRLLHGARMAFSRDTAEYDRVVLDTASKTPSFTTVSLRHATALDLGYTLAWTWQPRRAALLAAGGGPALGLMRLDGEGLDTEQRFLAGLAGEIEAQWVGAWLLTGPFVRGSWLHDFSESGNSFAVALGLRAAVTF